MIRRPPRSTQSRSSAASDVYKRQLSTREARGQGRFLVAVPLLAFDERVPQQDDTVAILELEPSAGGATQEEQTHPGQEMTTDARDQAGGGRGEAHVDSSAGRAFLPRFY